MTFVYFAIDTQTVLTLNSQENTRAVNELMIRGYNEQSLQKAIQILSEILNNLVYRRLDGNAIMDTIINMIVEVLAKRYVNRVERTRLT